VSASNEDCHKERAGSDDRKLNVSGCMTFGRGDVTGGMAGRLVNGGSLGRRIRGNTGGNVSATIKDCDACAGLDDCKVRISGHATHGLDKVTVGIAGGLVNGGSMFRRERGNTGGNVPASSKDRVTEHAGPDNCKVCISGCATHGLDKVTVGIAFNGGSTFRRAGGNTGGNAIENCDESAAPADGKLRVSGCETDNNRRGDCTGGSSGNSFDAPTMD